MATAMRRFRHGIAKFLCAPKWWIQWSRHVKKMEMRSKSDIAKKRKEIREAYLAAERHGYKLSTAELLGMKRALTWALGIGVEQLDKTHNEG